VVQDAQQHESDQRDIIWMRTAVFAAPRKLRISGFA